MSPLEQLQEFGDRLERVIFNDPKFAPYFSNYPLVWAGYVLPNRDPQTPSFTTAQWLDIASHNYSAILACWRMWDAKLDLQELCLKYLGNPTDAELELKLQGHLQEFFWNAGPAIDNLRKAFASNPVRRPEAFETGDKSDDKSLAWIYDRRTQSGHEIVMPIIAGAVASIDVSLLRDANARWDWADGRNVRCLFEFVEQTWQSFAAKMNAQWGKFYGLLKKLEAPYSPPRNVPAEALPIFAIHLHAKSGSPEPPDTGWRRL